LVYDPVKLERLRQALLPGLPAEAVYEAYAGAAGKELEGKIFEPRSSSALAANAFGFFLNRPELLPPLPGTEEHNWPAQSLTLEAVVRFPWSGGRHPHLDVVITTSSALIGIESKRYEPFDDPGAAEWSEAYWRDCWGDLMAHYKTVRDSLRPPLRFDHLGATQLVKHAFGLRTQAHKRGIKAVLVYLYAEPSAWPDGTVIPSIAHEAHRREVKQFAELVSGDEVEFVSCSYSELLISWRQSDSVELRDHADRLAAAFLL
jgi:hypothetical protein